MNMKVLMVATFTGLALLVSNVKPAMATNCIKYPRKCAKEADRKRRQLTGNAIDIVTLGRTKRERERKEADAAKASAKQSQEHARQMKERVHQERIAQLQTIFERKSLIEKTLSTYSVLESGIQTTMNFIKILIVDSKIDKIKAQQIRELVVHQNLALATQLEENKSDDAELARMSERLVEKLHQYKNQVEMFPVETLNEEELDSFSAELIEQNLELLSLVQLSRRSMEQLLESTEQRIVQIQSEIEELKK